MISLDKPALPITTQTSTKPTLASLNTPLLDTYPILWYMSPSVVDIKYQIFRGDERSYAFSPITKPDTASQTETIAENKVEICCYSNVNGKLLEAALLKVTDVIERNGKALRDVDKSMTRIADSFARQKEVLYRLTRR